MGSVRLKDLVPVVLTFTHTTAAPPPVLPLHREVPTKSGKRPAAKKSRKAKAKDEEEDDEEEEEEDEDDLPGAASRKERDAEEIKQEEEAMKAPAYARKSGKHKVRAGGGGRAVEAGAAGSAR